MAHLVISGETLQLKLSPWEILGAFHSSPTVNLSQVESIEVEDNPWVREVLKGTRAPGTGIPFVVMLGTMRYAKGKDFVAIYRRRPCAILTFTGGKFKRWIFQIEDMGEIDAVKKLLKK
jgi:hypothetical protein